MTWQPEPQPEWVRAINRGEIFPIAEIARVPYDRDQLLGEARARLGMEDRGIGDFGDDGFLEPLGVLLPALEDEAELTVFGRWFTRNFLLRLLEVRLQLTAYVRSDPSVRDEEITAPLFVTGAPRTGTTLLYELLSRGPLFRVPEGWEFLRPVPPPDPATFASDPRIALAGYELQMPQIVASGLTAIHEYRARMPKECLSAMSFEFRSEEFVSRYHVPTYVTWLQRCDMRPAYEMHRLVLQVLQRKFRDVRWVLKSPVHLQSLSVLLDVYPDARIAVMHRDPLTVLGSVTSLIATLRSAQTDRVDFAGIGRYHADLYSTSLDRLVSHVEKGGLPTERVQHLAYADLAADPVGVVRKLSAHLDLGFTVDQLTAQPKGHRGEHTYSFDDLGLDRATERMRYERYQSYFRVPSEPPA
jgi:hypothetical protein